MIAKHVVQVLARGIFPALAAVLALGTTPTLAQQQAAGIVVLDDARACQRAIANMMPSPLGLYPSYLCSGGDWLLGNAPDIGGHMIEWLSDPEVPQDPSKWTYRQVTVADEMCTYDMSGVHADWHVVCPSN